LFDTQRNMFLDASGDRRHGRRAHHGWLPAATLELDLESIAVAIRRMGAGGGPAHRRPARNGTKGRHTGG
jgi:hypothetical protein